MDDHRQFALRKAFVENNIDSPAAKIFDLIMGNQGHQQGRSRLRVSHCRQDAVLLCIKYGIEFYEDDFEEMPCDEWLYAIACGCEREYSNKSACLAMEKHWGRKPFLVRDRDNKTPTRMYVGRRFLWWDGKKGVYLRCTSFKDKIKSFIACEYNYDEDNHREIPVRRFSITHADIKDFHKKLDEYKGGKKGK